MTNILGLFFLLMGLILACSPPAHAGDLYLQGGYFRQNGQYVRPHLKTTGDDFTFNNLKPSSSRRLTGLRLRSGNRRPKTLKIGF